jgi:SAM-dependent methyltransferase
MGELIEHLFDPDFALTEVYRVLKNDGSLILTFPNLASLPNRIRLMLGYNLMHFDVSLDDRHGGHIRGFTPFSIKKILNKHDFEVISIFGSSMSLNPFKRTNSDFGIFLGKLFPSGSDLLVVHAKKAKK